MNKIYIDTDAVLDLLLQREPHFTFTIELFTLIEKNVVKGHVSGVIFTNLFYVLRKFRSRNEVIDSLKGLKSIIKILPITDEITELALNSDFLDFEDAVQYYTALNNNISFLITRNKKDYKKSEMTICTAQEFIKILSEIN